MQLAGKMLPLVLGRRHLHPGQPPLPLPIQKVRYRTEHALSPRCRFAGLPIRGQPQGRPRSSRVRATVVPFANLLRRRRRPGSTRPSSPPMVAGSDLQHHGVLLYDGRIDHATPAHHCEPSIVPVTCPFRNPRIANNYEQCFFARLRSFFCMTETCSNCLVTCIRRDYGTQGGWNGASPDRGGCGPAVPS